MAEIDEAVREDVRVTGATPIIETDRLTKSFGSLTALDALSLQVPPGITGVVGANGAGKSTLIKIALGLLAPTSGRITVLGRRPDECPQARSLVGYMPEHDCLPGDVSAADFVLHMARMSGLPRRASRERAADILRHVGLDEERHRAMGGYSTGMKQRAKLAQALVHDPSVVFLDEPTSGLDPRARDDMLELAARVHADFGISVLVTSHLLGELERICDRVVVLDGGALLRASATAELTQSTGTVTVEVIGPPRADHRLGQALIDRGLDAWPSGERIVVRVDTPEILDTIRDTAVELGLGLAGLREGRHTLDEVFTGPADGHRPPVEPEGEPA